VAAVVAASTIGGEAVSGAVRKQFVEANKMCKLRGDTH